MRLLLFIALATISCAPVRPWERGLVAHPCMQADGRPEEDAARAHMIGAREAAQGAAGDRGGGCGCR